MYSVWAGAPGILLHLLSFFLVIKSWRLSCSRLRSCLMRDRKRRYSGSELSHNWAVQRMSLNLKLLLVFLFPFGTWPLPTMDRKHFWTVWCIRQERGRLSESPEKLPVGNQLLENFWLANFLIGERFLWGIFVFPIKENDMKPVSDILATNRSFF